MGGIVAEPIFKMEADPLLIHWLSVTICKDYNTCAVQKPPIGTIALTLRKIDLFTDWQSSQSITNALSLRNLSN